MNTAVTSWRKSTRSGSTNSSDCIEVRRAWRKSTRSGSTDSSSCVEVSLCTDSDGFHLRDSKLGDGSPVFDLPPADLTSLLRSARCALRPRLKPRIVTVRPPSADGPFSCRPLHPAQ
ncbi:DUF397 domain-containing protein [Glycomyces paridis]|uniref:DUF397 domain-containing protein n=1 Tax=Glycomyces paridis TaxID=2126555 RepID=A0A4S8PV32_9ACTN|nr:DUF397 domain-containing protein [Glycomyces paridis]THV32109.1 DUF397 domain-containing protein [Glycomyces paridis]